MLGLQRINLAEAEITNKVILWLDFRDIDDEDSTKDFMYSPRRLLLAVGEKRPCELLQRALLPTVRHFCGTSLHGTAATRHSHNTRDNRSHDQPDHNNKTNSGNPIHRHCHTLWYIGDTKPRGS